MARIGFILLAVLAGVIAWTVSWLLGTTLAQRAVPDLLSGDQMITHLGILLAYIIYSAFLSALAGYVTARVAERTKRPMVAVYLLAGIQFVLGIVAEVSYWEMMPVWYHLVFLALVVPATVYGGVLRGWRRREPA